MPFPFTQKCWALASFLHYLISPLKFHWIGNILVTIMSLSCWVSEGGKWKALSCKCSLSKVPKVVGKYRLVQLFFLQFLWIWGNENEPEMFLSLKPAAASPQEKSHSRDQPCPLLVQCSRNPCKLTLQSPKRKTTNTTGHKIWLADKSLIQSLM